MYNFNKKTDMKDKIKSQYDKNLEEMLRLKNEFTKVVRISNIISGARLLMWTGSLLYSTIYNQPYDNFVYRTGFILYQ